MFLGTAHIADPRQSNNLSKWESILMLQSDYSLKDFYSNWWDLTDTSQTYNFFAYHTTLSTYPFVNSKAFLPIYHYICSNSKNKIILTCSNPHWRKKEEKKLQNLIYSISNFKPLLRCPPTEIWRIHFSIVPYPFNPVLHYSQYQWSPSTRILFLMRDAEQ